MGKILPFYTTKAGQGNLREPENRSSGTGADNSKGLFKEISTDARSSGNSVARKITEWLAFTAKKTTGPGSRS